MRGFQQPAIRPRPSETQQAFANLSRHRRAKLARAAQTTLVKADQWSRGDHVLADVAGALEASLKSLRSKK